MTDPATPSVDRPSCFRRLLNATLHRHRNYVQERYEYYMQQERERNARMDAQWKRLYAIMDKRPPEWLRND